MAAENEFLFYAFLTGIYITFVYDILRIFRRVFPQGEVLVSLEDMVFWIYCASKVFLLMYYESNGTLRWFAVLGAIAGMFLYGKLVSPFFVKYVSLGLQKLLGLFGKAIVFFLRPFARAFRWLRGKLEREAKRRAVRLLKRKELGMNFLKKKLTVLRKLHRIDT